MTHVIRALGTRDLRRYFSNPTGYVFITLFILLSGAAAFWQPGFFLKNLANLDELNRVYPYLLVFFISALTMGVWSEERKQGTDELLLTLPATDVDVVLGKYLAALGIYTMALGLSLSHVAVLVWLGRPDAGLMVSNYLGYWLTGAALIPVGMVASYLTSNATVAFILASLFCSVPVLVDAAAGVFGPSLGRRLAPFGLFFHFNEFARGVVSLSAVLYCVSLGALFLSANVLLINRRHWPRQTDRLPFSVHHAVRFAALAVAVMAVNVIVGRAGLRLDATAEQLHSLGGETRRLLRGLPSDRQVLIQAFVSPDVPQDYVQEREKLLSTLHEVQALARGSVEVVVEDTEPYSEAARTARERFGIVPRLISDPDSTRTDQQQVFLGVAFTSGPDEQVLPFLERGLSVEYELTRAIRVVSRTSRKRIGVVDTDAKVFGGVDFESGRPRLAWSIVNDLRKQYDVVQITPYGPITEPLDALLVVLPSTLLQGEMDHVANAIRAGVPALVVVDPVPAVDMRLAPAASMAARINPYADPTQALARKNTGDIQKMMASIGVTWPPARVAWDSYAPHPEMGQTPREVVFVARGSGSAQAFNPRHAATAGLQELMMLYAGYLQPSDTPGFTFEPLVRTGPLAGTVGYFQLVQPSEAGPVLNPNPPRNAEGKELVLAAEIRSNGTGTKPVRAIVIADLDFISDAAFEMRAGAPTNVSFDNIPFFLNCIDVLAGDDAFIELRKRRVSYRRLERVETRTRSFLERRTRDEQKAAADAQAALDAAQQNLNKMVQQVDERRDLDVQAKQIMARNLQETETRKLEVLRANIDQAKNAKIQAGRETMEAEVRRIQGAIRTTAVLLPPVPVFCLGIVILLRRRRRERESAAAVRRLRDGT